MWRGHSERTKHRHPRVRAQLSMRPDANQSIELGAGKEIPTTEIFTQNRRDRGADTRHLDRFLRRLQTRQSAPTEAYGARPGRAHTCASSYGHNASPTH